MHGVVGLCADRLEREARGALRHGGGALEEGRAHDSRARTEGEHAAEEPAARDRALDHAVEFLDFGAGEIQLVPIVRGHLGGIDIFHVVSPWKPEVACRATRVRVGGGAAQPKRYPGDMTVP
jgi:hypothetical protein